MTGAVDEKMKAHPLKAGSMLLEKAVLLRSLFETIEGVLKEFPVNRGWRRMILRALNHLTNEACSQSTSILPLRLPYCCD